MTATASMQWTARCQWSDAREFEDEEKKRRLSCAGYQSRTDSVCLSRAAELTYQLPAIYFLITIDWHESRSRQVLKISWVAHFNQKSAYQARSTSSRHFRCTQETRCQACQLMRSRSWFEFRKLSTRSNLPKKKLYKPPTVTDDKIHLRVFLVITGG